MSGNKSTVNSSAMRYGTRMGLFMIVAFCLYIAGLRYSPIWSILSFLVIVYIPFGFFGGLLMWRFVQNMGQAKFLKLLFFGLLTFMYGTLLCSVAYYIYFQYLDHGFIIQNILNILSEKDSRNMMIQMTSLQQVEQMDATIKQLASFTPIQITIQLMNINFLFGSFLALVSAVIVANIKEPAIVSRFRDKINKIKRDQDNVD